MLVVVLLYSSLLALVLAAPCSIDITKFGAVGNGKKLNTVPIRNAFDAAVKRCGKTGGEVYVPRGTFLTGTVELKSNILLHLGPGAELLASDKPDNYPCIPTDLLDNGGKECEFNLIVGRYLTNTGIVGEGSINGGANDPPGHLVHYYNATTNMLRPLLLNFTCMHGKKCATRIQLVRFMHCTNVLVRGTVWKNSPGWTSSVSHSKNILVDKLTVHGDRRWPNNDGMDPISVHNMTIQNSWISTGDDCICLSTQNGTLSNVRVINCTLHSTSAALKIGHWSTDQVDGVLFHNITIKDSNRGIAVMPRRGRGGIKNVEFSNINIQTRMFSTPWWGNGEPIYITSDSQTQNFGPMHYYGTVTNILLRDIEAIGESGVLIYANASNAARLFNVTLKNSKITVSHWSNVTHSRLDLRPSPFPQLPKEPTHALWVQSSSGVVVKDVTFGYKGKPEPYYGKCWFQLDAPGLVRDNAQCHAPPK